MAMRLFGFVMALFLLFSFATVAREQYPGQFAQMPQELRDWFGNLRSKSRVLCCEDADGYDVNWSTDNGHYIVFSPQGWVVVPDEAVITDPSKVEVAKVWWEHNSLDGKFHVRCFLPGTFF